MTPSSELLFQFFSRLEAAGLDYCVGGSMASGMHGNPRQTNDLDLSIVLTESDVPRLVEAFSDNYMVSATEILDAVQSRAPYASFQILHMDELFKFDCFVHQRKPFDESCFERRQRVEIVPGLSVWCESAEGVLLRKLDWYKLGNCVSDKQWNDIVAIIEVQGSRLDLDYLREWAAKLGVTDLHQNAFAEAIKPD